MDLQPTDEQRLLAESARAFLQARWSTAALREAEDGDDGWPRELWSAMADLGWTGLALPRVECGEGQGMAELVVLGEELGRALLPSPLLASAVLCGRTVARLGSPEQRARWLPALADGTTIGTVAIVEPGMANEWSRPAARLHERGISGTKVFVPYGSSADLFLVTTRIDADDTLAVAAVEAGPHMVRRRMRTLGGDPLFEVELDGAPADVLAAGAPATAAVYRALDEAAVVSLSYAVGAAERALELSVAHARDREQFGRPIGSFQAVAHRCADMRADIDACRWLAARAAWALDHDVDAETGVAAAKAYGNDALRRIFMHAHQVHGAIGFSTEHDLQLFTRRAKAFELALGSTAFHHERLAKAMGL